MKVVFVTAGWSQLRLPTGTAQLGPGNIITIPESTWCAATPNGFARTVTIYMHGAFVDSHLQWMPSQHPLVHHLATARADERAPGVLNIGESGMQSLRPKLSALAALSSTIAGEFATLSRIAELFDAVTLLAGYTDQTSDAGKIRPLMIPRRQVAEAAYELHRHLNRVWTMADLASAVAISESQLSRLFRQDLGISPAAFLRNARADRMAELLVSTDMTVTESARVVGWENVSIASRAFKRRFGLSPSQFNAHLYLPSRFVENQPLQAF